GDDPALLARVPHDADRIDLPQPLARVARDAVLMRADARLADRLDIVDGSAQPDRLHDRGRAGLEFVRRVAIGDAILEHLADHFAAAVERPHRGEVFVLAVE